MSKQIRPPGLICVLCVSMYMYTYYHNGLSYSCSYLPTESRSIFCGRVKLFPPLTTITDQISSWWTVFFFFELIKWFLCDSFCESHDRKLAATLHRSIHTYKWCAHLNVNHTLWKWIPNCTDIFPFIFLFSHFFILFHHKIRISGTSSRSAGISSPTFFSCVSRMVVARDCL